MRSSTPFATLMFMVLSAATMTGFRITQSKRFWFISLPPIEDNANHTNFKYCCHPKNCQEYLLGEFVTTSKIAGSLGILKFIMSQGKNIRSNLSNLVTFFLKNVDYGMMAFTILYGGIFKTINCWLNNRERNNSWRNGLFAGFVSGITYWLYPKYMVFTFGLTTTLHMFWLGYMKRLTKGGLPPSRIVEFLDSMPWSSIIILFCMPMMFHYRMFYPYATPLFVRQFMSLGTANR